MPPVAAGRAASSSMTLDGVMLRAAAGSGAASRVSQAGSGVGFVAGEVVFIGAETGGEPLR